MQADLCITLRNRIAKCNDIEEFTQLLGYRLRLND